MFEQSENNNVSPWNASFWDTRFPYIGSQRVAGSGLLSQLTRLTDKGQLLMARAIVGRWRERQANADSAGLEGDLGPLKVKVCDNLRDRAALFTQVVALLLPKLQPEVGLESLHKRFDDEMVKETPDWGGLAELPKHIENRFKTLPPSNHTDAVDRALPVVVENWMWIKELVDAAEASAATIREKVEAEKAKQFRHKRA